MQLDVTAENWALGRTLRISRSTRQEVQVCRVDLHDGSYTGRGESYPNPRYGVSMEEVKAQLEQVAPRLSGDTTNEQLQSLLPAGAARNALDCALWDLRARRAGTSVWELAGVPRPEPVGIAYTLSLDSAEAMAQQARDAEGWPLLKLKLGGEDDDRRMALVREAAPDKRLAVDCNEAWTPDQLRDWLPLAATFGIEMLEQPLPAGHDQVLTEVEHVVPVAADESCYTCTSLPELRDRYDIVNIKLDKTGGLTEALRLKTEAAEMGLEVMVGCNPGTSLSIAPALLCGSGIRYKDLDATLWLRQDRPGGVSFEKNLLHPPAPEFWGN